MIANVIPLKRLPRRLGVFSYDIPKEAEAHIAVGQLVQIPFRRTSMFGIVSSIDTVTPHTQTSPLKTLEAIIHTVPLFSPEDIATAITWSSWYHLSPATLLTMMAPPRQKRKLRDLTLPPLPPIPQKTSGTPQYTYYKNQTEHHSALHAAIRGKTLIIVPEIHHCKDIASLLSAAEKERILFWHSDMSPKEQFATWFAWRNTSEPILIGTRSALLLPTAHVDTIIIDREHDEQHKQWDQAPRFYAHDLVTHLSKTYGCTLHLMSFSPSIESYYKLYEREYAMTGSDLTRQERLFSDISSAVRCIDMQEERRAGRYTVFSDTAKDALRDARGDIFLCVQRRGFSTAVGCNSCGHVETCPTCTLPLIFHEEERVLRCHYCHYQKPMVTVCTNCHAQSVELRGTGTEFIESGVRKFFDPTAAVHIYRIDGDLGEPKFQDEKTRRIIVGTEMAFRFIRWEKTEYVLFVDIDKQLQRPEYRATENVWHMIQEVLYNKQPTAHCDIQTFSPTHLVFKSFKEPDRLYRTELQSRHILKYPPYAHLIRLFFGHPEERAAEEEAARLYTLLTERLTENKTSAILHPPIAMHPRYFRQQFWHMMILRCSLTTWQRELPDILTHVPDTWKVDPHPLSLLSP